MQTRGTISMLGAFLALSCASFAADAPSMPVTFTKDVAPIFQAKCEECHRKGTAAPMSLATYEETRPWARSIKERVATRNMPPWHIDKTSGIQGFSNDRSLSDAEMAIIVRWVDSGAVKGDPKDMPAAKQWPADEGWLLAKQFGEPDLVIKSDPYTVAAYGQDQWWKPVVDVPLTEARWVRGVEIRPGTVAGRKVTHHALANLEQDESGRNTDSLGGPSGLLMEWAIGKQYDAYRENTGKLMLPGSKIRWDIHYHSVGEQIRDHVELGVYFYPKDVTPKYRTRLTLLSALAGGNNSLDIPPNSTYQTQAFHVLNQPARLENFQPHMHLHGKAMSMEAILPDGSTKMISYVNNFDFNWMNNYIYSDEDAPVLPKGTILKITAWYDNTATKKGNPDPNQWVGYGDRTVDEMGHAWVNITNITEKDYQDWSAAHQPARARAGGR